MRDIARIWKVGRRETDGATKYLKEEGGNALGTRQSPTVMARAHAIIKSIFLDSFARNFLQNDEHDNVILAYNNLRYNF